MFVVNKGLLSTAELPVALGAVVTTTGYVQPDGVNGTKDGAAMIEMVERIKHKRGAPSRMIFFMVRIWPLKSKPQNPVRFN